MELFYKSRIKALIVGFILAKILVTAYYLSDVFQPVRLIRETPMVTVAHAAPDAPEAGSPGAKEFDKPVTTDAVEEEAPLLSPEDIRAVMDTLERKRKALQEEEARLKKERAGLDAVKVEIEEKIEELMKVQKKIEENLNQKTALAAQEAQNKTAAEEKKIKQLVKVYTSMKPKNAAAIVDKMDMKVVLRVFRSMKGDQVGKILTFVNRDRAAKISELLAERKEK